MIFFTHEVLFIGGDYALNYSSDAAQEGKFISNKSSGHYLKYSNAMTYLSIGVY